MRPKQNAWKLVSIALAAMLLVMFLSSRVEPARADSPGSHFTIFHGTAPFGVASNGGPAVPTMFRLDTISGEVLILTRNVNGVHQWLKIAEPPR
jgi:hypothetical protein